jgi:structural maintenance of chromosome 4
MILVEKEKERECILSLKRNQELLRSLTDKIGAMKNAVRSAAMGDKILQSLKEAQRLGKLSGVFGRLGNLGTIPQQFDVAISTACGMLDYILVDTVSSGEKCLQYLRENRIGRGNFICLDRITQQLQ